jgi:NhaP-type Na+/H+ and K+/H+ antiporter
MRPPRCVVHDRESVSDALAELRVHHVHSAPLVDDDDRYLGVVDADQLAVSDPATPVSLSGVAKNSMAPMLANRHLDVVLESLTSWGASWLAVIDDERRVVGTVSVSDIVTSYRRFLQANLENASMFAVDSGMVSVRVDPRSALCDVTLRAAHLPHGTLITAIERGRDVLVPTGDTAFEVGDRLTAIGTASDLQRLRDLAGPASSPAG